MAWIKLKGRAGRKGKNWKVMHDHSGGGIANGKCRVVFMLLLDRQVRLITIAQYQLCLSSNTKLLCIFSELHLFVLLLLSICIAASKKRKKEKKENFRYILRR